jgi:hypothetical protein
MSISFRHLVRSALVVLWILATGRVMAQLEIISPQLARSSGVDSSSGIAYTRLYLLAQTATPTGEFEITQPTLTAQCTKRPNGKLGFEMFINFGHVADVSFYPPWKPVSGELFPPHTVKARYTMEFLGYTKVSPYKREFEHVVAPEGQLRYNEPGGSSGNMEPVSYFLQYLRSLPTLRVTGEGHTATFLTTSLLLQLHREPLCSAAGA